MLKKIFIILGLYYLSISIIACCNCNSVPKPTFEINKIKLSLVVKSDSTLKGTVLNLEIIDSTKSRTACVYPKSNMFNSAFAMERCTCSDYAILKTPISNILIMKLNADGTYKEFTSEWVADINTQNLKVTIKNKIESFNQSSFLVYGPNASIIFYHIKPNEVKTKYIIGLTLKNGTKLISNAI